MEHFSCLPSPEVRRAEPLRAVGSCTEAPPVSPHPSKPVSSGETEPCSLGTPWARSLRGRGGAETSGSGPPRGPTAQCRRLRTPEAGGRPGRRGGGGSAEPMGSWGRWRGGSKSPPGGQGRASAREEEERRGGLPPRAAPRSGAGARGWMPAGAGAGPGLPGRALPWQASRAVPCPGGARHAQTHGEIPKLQHRGAPG